MQTDLLRAHQGLVRIQARALLVDNVVSHLLTSRQGTVRASRAHLVLPVLLSRLVRQGVSSLHLSSRLQKMNVARSDVQAGPAHPTTTVGTKVVLLSLRTTRDALHAKRLPPQPKLRLQPVRKREPKTTGATPRLALIFRGISKETMGTSLLLLRTEGIASVI